LNGDWSHPLQILQGLSERQSRKAKPMPRCGSAAIRVATPYDTRSCGVTIPFDGSSADAGMLPKCNILRRLGNAAAAFAPWKTVKRWQNDLHIPWCDKEL
jgi:hypothetical protein